MALLLTEGDVRGLLTMPAAIAAVEESFRRLATGNAIVHSRQRLHIPGKSYLHYMAAADATGGYMGLKIYSSAKEGLRFIVPLFNVTTGDLAAVIEADFLGQVRTGAASGVATRLMSREDPRVVGIIGTGLQARTQLEAVSLMRKVGEVRVCGRDANRREKFVVEMSARLKVPVRSAANAEEAVRDADIVITSTTSTNPVVEGRWLKKGTHINAIGANFPQKTGTGRRCGRPLRCDCRRFARAIEARVGRFDPVFWPGRHALEPRGRDGDIVAGRCQGGQIPNRSLCSSRTESRLRIRCGGPSLRAGPPTKNGTGDCVGEGADSGKRKALDSDAAKPLLKSVPEPRRVSSGSGAGSELQIDLNCLLGRVHYHVAVVAMLEVLFDRGFQRGIKLFVEVVRKFFYDVSAVHEFSLRSKIPIQFFSQLQARAQQSRFHSRHGQAKGFGSLFGGKFFDVAQLEDGPEGRFQFTDHLGEYSGELVLSVTLLPVKDPSPRFRGA